MTTDQETECIRIAFDGMTTAQFLSDEAQNRKESIIISMLYSLFRIVYLLLTDRRKRNKNMEE